ncbi:amidohydrolase family protein [Streptomyces sp. t39]|uniref:amidohydrolase family protein n=1 Tax=Streptomyces sp. t39 TaxID=1828156 RepID=UPI0011CE9166|nr:amidohydrolase family protein [Streptomyces sp. t39]TXS52825.1 amidohydrolase [Streptomyces sp. t39]
MSAAHPRPAPGRPAEGHAVPAGPGSRPGPLAVPRVVDAHHHLWDRSALDLPWLDDPALEPIRRDFLPADLARATAGTPVDATVLVQTVCDTRETVSFLATAAAGGPIAGVVGWTDLTAPGVADALAELRSGPGGDRLVGIRHQVQEEADPGWLLRPDVGRGLTAVGGAGLVYDLVVRPHQLPAARAAAARHPGLRFVLDHAGKPPVATGRLTPWADDLRRLAALPNTTCKLSGLVTEAGRDGWTVAGLAPYADAVLDAFGPGRVMFGSDWPVCLPAAGYAEVLDTARALTARLDPGEREAFFAGTATRVYGLRPAVQGPSA